jgi:hypothetical protein
MNSAIKHIYNNRPKNTPRKTRLLSTGQHGRFTHNAGTIRTHDRRQEFEDAKVIFTLEPTRNHKRRVERAYRRMLAAPPA